MIYARVHMGSGIFVCKYGVFVEYGLGFVNLRYIYACVFERENVQVANFFGFYFRLFFSLLLFTR